jgi:glycosyltransferase involved in cell wall biosynthesis
MKVLVCIPCLLTGGTEIQTLSLVNALISADHEVTTVCYFEFAQNMVEKYRQAGSEVILLSHQGLRPEGTKNVITFLYKGLKRAVRQFQPDIAHVQYMAPGAIPIIILRLLGVKKIIATAHTAADIYPSLHLLHFVAKYLLVAFTCITERAEKSFFGDSQLYSNNFQLKKRGNHFTIFNCLPSYITVRKNKRIQGNVITLGVVSRLEKIKGMDLVVPAFARVYKTCPNIKLLIVGDGSQRELMESQVKDEDLSDAVTFAGRQTQEVLQKYYDQIDVLLMPSRSEGFGLTAIEGMARGCVVVASNVGGLPEVLAHSSGLLHQSESVDDMVGEIVYLIQDKDRLLEISDGARERAKQFSAKTFGENIQNLYSKLTSK